MSEIERIVDQFEREQAGDAWHGSPLQAVLSGIGVQQAAQRPARGVHSIWEIVLHITAWKNEVRKRVSGSPAGEPEEGDWPDIFVPTEERWHEAIATLQRAHEELIAAVRALPEAQLHEPTKDPRNRPLGTGETFYVTLLGLVQHDVYHAGQIAILKKIVA